MDNEFILQDRIQKIQQIIKQYGEENFFISYSGGKDSNVLSALVDMALPENKIPRVYCNTGIEYKVIVDFVKDKAAADDRFIIIQPKTPIKQMLEEKGYPFKSKEHSEIVGSYQKNGVGKWVAKYLKTEGRFACPDVLRYQFTPEFTLHISDKCCEELKEKPMALWQRKNNKPYGMLGIMPAEGGETSISKMSCI